MSTFRSSFVRSLLIGSCLLLMAGSCEFSIGETPEGVAEELIEGELAEHLGITGMVATCEAPPDSDAGTTFACTAQSDMGEVHWIATMKDSETVNVRSTNVLDDEDVSVLESGAVEALEAQVGRTLGVENFDCGEGPIVVGADNNVACVLTDPGNGDLYDTTLTITDFDTGTFDIDVAGEPR